MAPGSIHPYPEWSPPVSLLHDGEGITWKPFSAETIGMPTQAEFKHAIAQLTVRRLDSDTLIVLQDAACAKVANWIHETQINRNVKA